MALSSGSKRMIACPFEECLGDQWCPHAVQVALATDRVGTPGGDGAEIASQNVINAPGGSSEGGGGLVDVAWWQWEATAPRQGGEEADRWYVLKTDVAEI